MSVSLKLPRAVLGAVSFGVIGLFACSEPTAPPVDGDLVLAQAASASAKRTSSDKIGTDALAPGSSPSSTALPANTVKFATWTQPSTRDTSFSVVVGTASTHQIMYKGTLMPFLKLEIPANADFFDATGRTLRKGTIVTVTTLVDPVYAAVRFGPHGTRFDRTPARICLNYYGFEFVGSPSNTMAIWYQPDIATSWAAQPTAIDMDFFWLCAPLSHFSNYAVAY